MKILSKLFSDKEFIHEEYEAFFNKLPEKVAVDWNKDGKWIVGKIFIQDENDILYTQAKDPDEFLDMVNDAVYMHFEIKDKYKLALSQSSRQYRPSVKEWIELNDGSIRTQHLSLEKQVKSA